MSKLVAAFAHLGVLRQQAVHRPDRAVVDPPIEETREHLANGEIGVLVAVERAQHFISLLARETTRRRRGRRHDRRSQRPPPRLPIVGGTRYRQRRAGGSGANDWREVRGELHRDTSLLPGGELSGIPRTSCSFFWNSMMVSACFRRWRRLVFSRSSCWIRLASAESLRGCSPRCFGVRRANAPAARSRRHVVSNDEYSPSRRKSTPMAPGAVAASAAARRAACTPP